MKVILLAAGRSRRVKPIEDKNFLNFCGKPLIWHQLEALRKAGFNDFILIGGRHNLEKLRNLAQNFEGKIQVVEQKDLERGMAEAVLSVKPYLKDEAILVVSTNDVVEEKAYQLIFEAARNPGFTSFLLAKKVERYFPGGYLKISSGGMVEEIVEKPGEGNEPSDLINLVVHLHQKPEVLFHYLERVKSSKDDLYEVALDQMIKDGYKMQAVSYEGFWQALKYPWHLFRIAHFYFERTKKEISKEAAISEKAVIKGEVIIEEGVKIFEGAIVKGPVYLGKNTVVANNALVRESFLSENCVVGYSTEIARSYLGNKVWTHSNYIGDSIIGSNCAFGSGAVTGNLRLDEGNIKVEVEGEKIDAGTNKLGAILGDNIRVGINTSLMPGIKIGSNSLIGAGITVNQNIPENSFVTGKWELKIEENKAVLDQRVREKMRQKLE